MKNEKVVEIQCDYNENDKIIHFVDPSGFEIWNDYDKNGNLIHYKNSNGTKEEEIEYWKEYDENNNLTHYKNSCGYEESWKYYKNSIYKYCKYPNGSGELIIYDKYNNSVTCYKNDKFENLKDYKEDSTVKDQTIKRDEEGRITYCKFSDKMEYWIEYNEDDKVLHSVYDNGLEEWITSDYLGNILFYKNSEGFEY